MNRLSILLPLCLGGLCLQAQTSSAIVISTNPSGARFQVDGTTYTHAATFNWPQGSEHVVVFVTDPPVAGASSSLVQTSLDGSTVWALSGWADNKGLVQPAAVPVQVVTADPAITTFTAQLTVSYKVSLNFFSIANVSPVPPTCGAPGAIPPGYVRPGVVYIGSQCFWSSTSVLVAAGSNVALNAYPYPGFAFTGWSINGTAPTPFLTALTVNSPLNIAPNFVSAKRVSFTTSPPGLQLLIDHTQVPTRSIADAPDCPNNETVPIAVQLGFPPMCFGDFDFVPGSTHIIGGVTPQTDQMGHWWVFDSWSSGASQNGIYQVDMNPNVSGVVTANFLQGAQVALVTTPTLLPLTVDGRSNWPSYNFVWGVGTTHQVSAAATQKGPNGRMYTFQGWSNQSGSSQSISVDQGMVNSGYRLTANYSVLSRLVIQSSPSGLTVQVDGASCLTPCNVDRATGATVHVTATTQSPMGNGARMDFGSWSDGGASDHVITISQDYAVATVSYNTSYLLNATSNPGNGSAFKFSPSSSDMFYPQGTQVGVTAVPNQGFKFGHWSGDLIGSYSSGTVTMTAPINVVAQMITVPYIAPAGILNGVGQTPSSAVASGSVISIFGQSLASMVEIGPVNPLSQTIEGTSVTVNNSILPLMFVSPQQINAQLPSNLANGDYTLIVHNTGQPDITGAFTVARNAPGLFFNTVGDTAYALAFHADGSLVSTDSPAVGGETISFLGTGFGPYQTPVFDGFYPPNPPPAVADSVSLSVNGGNVTSTSTAAPNYAGIVSTTFQVPSGLPSATSVPVVVTINGVDSNTVKLPVQ